MNPHARPEYYCLTFQINDIIHMFLEERQVVARFIKALLHEKSFYAPNETKK